MDVTMDIGIGRLWRQCNASIQSPDRDVYKSQITDGAGTGNPQNIPCKIRTLQFTLK
jgi:hypothetical protein